MNINLVCDSICNGCHMDSIVPIFFGIYVHIYKICLIRINSDQTEQYLTPGPSSIFFCLALCCLASEYNNWPLYLKKPHNFFIILYQVIFSSFFVDIGMRTIYVSSRIFYHWLFHCIFDQVASLSMGSLIKYSEFFNTKHAEDIFSLFISFSVFILVLYSTEKLDKIEAILNITKKNSSILSPITEEQITSRSTFQIECVLQEEPSKISIIKQKKK